MQSAVQGNQGFSLIEVLVAMLLLMIAFSGTMAMQLTVMRASGDSRTTSTAMVLAQNRIEQFRMLKKDILTTGTETPTSCPVNAPPCCFDYNAQPLLNCSGANVFYRRNTTIARIAPNNNYQITVRISWGAAEGSKQITMGLERSF